MARYHFNIRDGVTLSDKDGMEFLNLRDARTEATRFVANLLNDPSDAFFDGQEWNLEVTDAKGRRVMLLSFTGVMAEQLESPVTIC